MLLLLLLMTTETRVEKLDKLQINRSSNSLAWSITEFEGLDAISFNTTSRLCVCVCVYICVYVCMYVYI
jgi:hypothetical protein